MEKRLNAKYPITIRAFLKKKSWKQHCYIIAEGFFFILSFFVGYILSFGLVRLWTIQHSARAGAHIEYSSRSPGEDVTITNVIIKPPDRKWDWGMNDVMPGINGLGILVIFENQLVKIWRWTKRVEISTWARPVEIWSWMRRVQFVVYGMRRAFVG